MSAQLSLDVQPVADPDFVAAVAFELDLDRLLALVRNSTDFGDELHAPSTLSLAWDMHPTSTPRWLGPEYRATQQLLHELTARGACRPVEIDADPGYCAPDDQGPDTRWSTIIDWASLPPRGRPPTEAERDEELEHWLPLFHRLAAAEQAERQARARVPIEGEVEA